MSAVAGLCAATVVIWCTWPSPATRRPRPAPAPRTEVIRPPMGRVAVVVGALVVAVALGPVLGLGVVIGAWGWQRHRRASASRRARAALVRTLPDVVDLLLLTTEAGLSLPLAHPVVAAVAPAPLGPVLADADARSRAGAPRADALADGLVASGEGAAALAHVLVDHLRYGTPLGAALEGLRIQLRTDRRHAVEEAARQVPVRLLGPLVLCVLPAFAALTVVPLLLASVDALPR